MYAEGEKELWHQVQCAIRRSTMGFRQHGLATIEVMNPCCVRDVLRSENVIDSEGSSKGSDHDDFRHPNRFDVSFTSAHCTYVLVQSHVLPFCPEFALSLAAVVPNDIHRVVCTIFGVLRTQATFFFGQSFMLTDLYRMSGVLSPNPNSSFAFWVIHEFCN